MFLAFGVVVGLACYFLLGDLPRYVPPIAAVVAVLALLAFDRKKNA
ncbi:MAG: hypothetical protein V4574_11640 [Pseudomonadota bacterium]